MTNAAVLAIAALAYAGSLSVQAIQPFGGAVTDDRTPLFEWSGPTGMYVLMIDDDPEFGSPLTYDISGTSYAPAQDLDFGDYWWKVVGGSGETMPRRLTVVSTVALSRPSGDHVENSGNTPVILHRDGVTGAAILAVNQSLEIGEDENVKAEQE